MKLETITNLLIDASLPCGSEALFPKPFRCFFYQNQTELLQQLPMSDALIVRSTLKVDHHLLSQKPKRLQVIATASSGIDHLHLPLLQQYGIHHLDAKGANAIAVADYVLSCLAYLIIKKQRQIETIGIIGHGAVGKTVLSRLLPLGFKVRFYDPYVTHPHPLKVDTLEALLANDLLSIHANLHDHLPYPSRALLNESILKQLKPHTAIIQASRGGILSEKALLALKKPLCYLTDVFENEPHISKAIIDTATICTPHIAGHSIEAKKRAMILISKKIHRYFKLKIPLFQEINSSIHVVSNKNWQNTVLRHYDPISETLALKQSTDLRETFQSLRKAHTFRHELSFSMR